MSSTPTAAAANANWESTRERGILFAPEWGGGGRLRSAVTVRAFWLFGEVVCVENQMVTQYCSGCAQKDFLKGELKHAGQGPYAQLPYQQGESIEGVVFSH